MNMTDKLKLWTWLTISKWCLMIGRRHLMAVERHLRASERFGEESTKWTRRAEAILGVSSYGRS